MKGGYDTVSGPRSTEVEPCTMVRAGAGQLVVYPRRRGENDPFELLLWKAGLVAGDFGGDGVLDVYTGDVR